MNVPTLGRIRLYSKFLEHLPDDPPACLLVETQHIVSINPRTSINCRGRLLISLVPPRRLSLGT